MIRKKQESITRYLLAFMLAACATPLILGMIIGSTDPIVEEPTVTTVTEETTTTEIVTTTTTTELVTTTTTETTTTMESSSSETTVTTMTTSSETTTTTKHLMTYDILTRIDMISMLLDESDYKRLVEKDPANLTAEERTELQYYACLVFERKQLREYLSKNKSE